MIYIIYTKSMLDSSLFFQSREIKARIELDCCDVDFGVDEDDYPTAVFEGACLVNFYDSRLESRDGKCSDEVLCRFMYFVATRI